MSNILRRFEKNLTAIEHPKDKTTWNVAGILKNQNAFYRFDVRDMFLLPEGNFAQKGSTKTQAQKMVFEFKDKWLIIDIEELHEYLKNNKTKIVYLDKIIKEFYWNIIVNKE